MYTRNIIPNLVEALSDTPVVLLNGARQTGKSTLVKSLAEGVHPARYMTLDDAGVLSAAKSDPAGFLAGMTGPVVLDEVQRAPQIFLAIKAEVDRNRVAGRFLLTGSADVMLLPNIADSLAGRMEIMTLWPFSQGETENIKESFVDALFSDEMPCEHESDMEQGDIVNRMLLGGYPEVCGRPSEKRRNAWFASYITTILQRDIRDLSNIEGLTELPHLLSLLAARSSSLLNFAELSRSIGIAQTTLKRYMALLETTFLIQMLPAWSANLGKRLVKSPKLILNDTGLLGYLSGVNIDRLERDRNLMGHMLENFVVMELRKQLGWSTERVFMFHYRTQAGQETDIVLENADGRIVGIEVKASATVVARDFSGLRALSESVGERFQRGILLYTGRHAIPFAENMHALPLSNLWQIGSSVRK